MELRACVHAYMRQVKACNSPSLDYIGLENYFSNGRCHAMGQEPGTWPTTPQASSPRPPDYRITTPSGDSTKDGTDECGLLEPRAGRTCTQLSCPEKLGTRLERPRMELGVLVRWWQGGRG